MRTKFLHILGSLFGLLLFTVALWLLSHELKAYHLRDITHQLHKISSYRLFLAFGLTILSYAIMTGYDTLALHYIRHPLSYGKTALASFIGYAFSNNMGFGMLAGGSIRYRLYSAWGVSPMEITKVVVFCSLTLWLGFLTLGGFVFLLEPLAIPKALHLPFVTVRPLGLFFFLFAGFYLSLVFLRKRPLKIRDWELTLPSAVISASQIVLAILDWALAGSVLYVLLPASSNLSYPGFLGIFLLGQTAGLASQIPGGLGVFESVVLLLLVPVLPASEVFGSLLIYRFIYYLLPLLAAAVLLGIQETLRQKKGVWKIAQFFGRWVSALVPPVLALTTFLGGVILLFSGATPAEHSRLEWLGDILPLPLVEISDFLGSLIGVGLLLLARGIQRRLDAAYTLTAAFLAAGILFSLLKGLDYEEAIILFVMLGALLPCRSHFYRKASLISQRFTPGWVAAIVLVLLCSVWLGMFSYKHVEYSSDLWWRFALFGDAPRFIRAMVGAIGFALFFAIAKLLRPLPPHPEKAGMADRNRAVTVVRQSPRSYANLALLGDKTFLFSQTGKCFIMYRIEGRSWVAMGDPVGPVAEWSDLVWQFREVCDRYDGWTVFYEVGSENLHLYLDLGLKLLKLGEEARLPLETFSLEGSARKSLRQICRKLEREGYTFELVPPENTAAHLPEFKQISDAWLAQKKTKEMGFSLGFFDLEYLKRFPAAVVRKEEGIVAFANVWPGTNQEELSIDLMRHLSGAPQGIMDFLFVRLMLWGKQEGYRWFNLGMAPLAGLENRIPAPLWNRVGAFVFDHGKHFYHFQGLRKYKEKFHPTWEPKYLAYPGGMALPQIFTNLKFLISRGPKGLTSNAKIS